MNLLQIPVALLATSLLISPSLQAQEFSARIVGGTEVTDARYPFMASVYLDADGDSTFFPSCGGSLVGSRWIMTAAHCVVNATTGQIQSIDRVGVLVGALDISDRTQGEFVGVQSIEVHPSYEIATSVADLALIELQAPVDLSVLAQPVVGSDIPLVGELSTVAGWGTTSEGGFISSDLLEVQLPIVAHAACLPLYPNQLRSDANVCAGGLPEGGLDSCQGDSGSPLFVQRDDLLVQAGIVSYGEGCARPGIPGVYTRVTTYIDWVASIVPDLVFAGSVSNVDAAEQTIADLQVVTLDEDTPEQSDTVTEGAIDTYEVTGASRVELTTLTGDADLFIFSGTDFESEDVICSSFEITALDACDLPDTTDRLFAQVFGFLDSTYEIRINSETDGTQDVIVVDPDDTGSDTGTDTVVDTDTGAQDTGTDTVVDTDTGAQDTGTDTVVDTDTGAQDTGTDTVVDTDTGAQDTGTDTVVDTDTGAQDTGTDTVVDTDTGAQDTGTDTVVDTDTDSGTTDTGIDDDVANDDAVIPVIADEDDSSDLTDVVVTDDVIGDAADDDSADGGVGGDTDVALGDEESSGSGSGSMAWPGLLVLVGLALRRRFFTREGSITP